MVQGLLNQRSIIVPTDDAQVRKQLRDFNQPMCFFGEGPAERRERLAKVIANLDPEEKSKYQSQVEASNQIQGSHDGADKDQIFYYEGCEALKKARFHIADYSIRQSSDRLDLARISQLEPLSTRLIPQQDLIERVRRIEDLGSWLDGDDSTTELKTLTSCTFNPNSDLLATSCRSGKCKLWTVPDMEARITLQYHKSNASSIVFSPKSGDGLAETDANLASSAMDGSVVLWNLVDESPVCRLSGPQKWRVNRVRYHPTGSYLATANSDNSWRLWDMASETEILHQEGHSDAVADLAFHPDGSLAASAGMDSYARLWDLRTGRSIQLLEGHSKGIRCLDFSPNGYQLATGSMDNLVKIWNLRQRRLEYTIPAHVSTVSSVVFEKENGYFLATSSFDKTVKFWSSTTWAPVKTLEAYDDKVTKLDLSSRADYLVTCHFRHLKLWSTMSASLGECEDSFMKQEPQD